MRVGVLVGLLEAGVLGWGGAVEVGWAGLIDRQCGAGGWRCAVAVMGEQGCEGEWVVDGWVGVLVGLSGLGVG